MFLPEVSGPPGPEFYTMTILVADVTEKAPFFATTTDENGKKFELKSRFRRKENGCPAKMGMAGEQ